MPEKCEWTGTAGSILAIVESCIAAARCSTWHCEDVCSYHTATLHHDRIKQCVSKASPAFIVAQVNTLWQCRAARTRLRPTHQ